MADPQQCADVQQLLPELAAGVADGDARARALAHVAHCATCRRELEDLSGVLDRLLLLAPEREPAAGFELSVLSAIAPPGRRPARRTSVLLAAAACLLVAASAAGLVWWQTADDRHLADQYRHTLAVANGRALTSASVTAAGAGSVGHAFAYDGRPSWVFLTVASAPASGSFRVELVRTDGRVVDIGQCQVDRGGGSWGWTLYTPVRDIAAIRLVRAGAPTMSARFAT